VKIGSAIREILPSTFYMRKDGKIFIGDDADEMQDKDPVGYVTAVKKDIHKDGFLPMDKERQIGRVELVSHLFRHIREFVKKNVPHFRDKDIDECILTVPVIFSPPQREAIRRAAEMGGFQKVLRPIEEPVAAAKAYLFETKHQGIDSVVVCDIGGGTTDFAVVKRHGDLLLPVSEVPTGGVRLGGDDLDERVIEYVEKKDPDKEQHQSLWQRVWNWRNSYKSKIRSFKETLSRKSEDEKFECRVNGKQLSFPRTWLDECVNQFAQELCDELEEYLKMVHEKLGKDNVPILLAGGSSKLHGLEDKIKAIAGKSEVLTWQNSDYAIVLGAALEGAPTVTKTAPALKNVSAVLS
jgi:molecular chaperone DnaK (HSP70)